MLGANSRIYRFLYRNMNTFKQVCNPITGRSDWEPQLEDYDYHQEIAQAAFADMLHDDERNKKYYQALRQAIDQMHERGLLANVLDIGTGTGLLSMMAVRCGADSVIACEAFRPMADCAEQIIAANGMREKIKIIKKRSTDMIVGMDGDIQERMNILVTEVFDTELIGEGAIAIFNHAHDCLLENDCIVVPDSATIFAQIVESPFAWAWNKPKLLANSEGEILLRTPKRILMCRGSIALHDVQLNQFPKEQFKTIIDPIAVYKFDWSGKTRNSFENSSTTTVQAKCAGVMQVVFMWWQLQMDQNATIILSCAPYWAHPDYPMRRTQIDKSTPSQVIMPWRDHWMQAIYYLPAEVPVAHEMDEFSLKFNHDEYSLWFDCVRMENSAAVIPQAICDCGFHIAYSRTRIGQLNDNHRNKKYLNYFSDHIVNSSSAVVLCLSDGSLLSLALATMGCKKVYVLETNRYSHAIMEKYIEFNGLKNIELLTSLDDDSVNSDSNNGDYSTSKNFREITHVFGEPSFCSTILPWDSLYFGTLILEIKDRLPENVVIIPGIVRLYAVAVEFIDLQKIRAPLGSCEGFQLDIFDQLIEESCNLTDSYVEALPLWEYPCIGLSNSVELLQIDLSNFQQILQTTKELSIKTSGTCNGIALWCDWQLTKTCSSTDNLKYITTGPLADIVPGKFIQWDVHSRQGVHLFPQTNAVHIDDRIKCAVNFIPKTGKLSFHFELKKF